MKKLVVIILLLCPTAAFAQAGAGGFGGSFGAASGGCAASTEVGMNAGVQPKTFTSNAIVAGGVLGFTASGTLYCSDINLETNSTGLAAGTNFTVTSNSAFGLAVICAVTVANLNGNKTVKCSAGGVTNLQPFTLLDTNTLTLKCTVADCTGVGTIKITPNCMRLTVGASLS